MLKPKKHSNYATRLEIAKKRVNEIIYSSNSRLIIVVFILENKAVEDFDKTNKTDFEIEKDIFATIQKKSANPGEYWKWFNKEFPSKYSDTEIAENIVAFT
jgi:hypothetical protein